MANSTKASLVAFQARARFGDRELGVAFRYAKKHAPAILMLEDLDRLVRAQEVGISYFLNMLDGLEVAEGVLVIATSNYPEKLDPALLHRPSRFDRIWRFPLPALKERRRFLERKAGRFFSAAALDRAARSSNGFSMAYLQEIVVNAMLECIHEGASLRTNTFSTVLLL